MAHLTITAGQKLVSPDAVGLLSACINHPSQHHPVYLTTHSNGSLPPHLSCSEPEPRVALQTWMPRRVSPPLQGCRAELRCAPTTRPGSMSALLISTQMTAITR